MSKSKDLASHLSTKVTPQQEPVPGKSQVPNSEGGYVFAVDKWKRLERFLILGSEGGTYYISEKKLTQDNATCVLACLAEDPVRTVNTIVAVSDGGRAPKNEAAILALALAAKKGHGALAFPQLAKVCRIGTHLFHFADYI
jgi:60 kDa SS-A/Ro ribonucleoprotein